MADWEMTHMEPRWKQIQTGWAKWTSMKQEVDAAKKYLADISEPSRDIWPYLHALGGMGLLEEPVKELRLTPLGTMATEVNEGHPILMPQAYQRGFMKGLDARAILAVLACFMQESGEMPAVDSLRVPAPVISTLWRIYDLGEENQAQEKKVGAPRPPRDGFWQLNTTWVEPVWRWLDGASAQELCADYSCYEGNLMRMLMKMVNILEEWRSLATLSLDTEMLEKMRGLEEQLLRDVAVCDSLYLRL
jgi:superfamily II RNA helicase